MYNNLASLDDDKLSACLSVTEFPPGSELAMVQDSTVNKIANDCLGAANVVIACPSVEDCDDF